ncbi:MAG: hypothetical protein JSR54_07125, partial [Proteobacteria bacterium]|nr:hypothetical protein [Pseudomonadota bacterium]
VALAAWPLAERIGETWRARLLAAAAGAALLLAHAVPAATAGHGSGVHWVPFTDLAPHGAHLAWLAHLGARLFWYGGLAWLLVEAGLGAWAAGIGAAGAVALAEAVRVAGAPTVQYASATDPACALLVALALGVLARGATR